MYPFFGQFFYSDERLAYKIHCVRWQHHTVHRGIRAYHKNFFAYDFSTDMYNLIHILRQEIEIGHILAKKGIKF